ncbi:MAG: hypothetical protein ACLPKT_25490 [Methylocella sp.]
MTILWLGLVVEIVVPDTVARRAAMLASLIETAKLSGINAAGRPDTPNTPVRAQSVAWS